MPRSLAIVLALSIPAALAAQSPALDAAAATLGGKERILAVRTLVLDGRGTQLNFGQNLSPFAETQFEVTSWRRSVDFVNRRWFMDLTRVPKFTTGNMNPQRQRTGLDGAPDGIAYNVTGGQPAAPGVPAPEFVQRVGGTAPADRMFDFLLSPIGFMQAAYRPGMTPTESAAPNGMRRVTIDVQGTPVSMLIDVATNLPTRIERGVYQPMLGDVTLTWEMSDYQDAGSGIKMPTRWKQRYGNLFTLADFTATARVDGDVGNLAVSDSVRNALVQPVNPNPDPVIAVDTLAPGVWRIAGGSHHTIAIEQSNRIVLVEAPQSETRTLAVIAQARALTAKPVELVINTHHHFDHAGGFRAAVSQGLQVATHQGNKDFYERVVFPGVHKSQPDALAKSPKPLRLMTIGDRHVMRDDLRTIEIHHMPGNPHNANMLVVYLPAEKILIQADLYNPPVTAPLTNAPAPVFPFVANMMDNVTRRNLQVERVAGIHGTPVPWSQVQAAAASATRTP